MLGIIHQGSDTRDADSRTPLGPHTPTTVVTANNLGPAESAPAAKAPASAVKKPGTPRRLSRTDRSLPSLLVKYLLPVGALALIGFAIYQVVETRRIDVAVAPPVQPPQAPYSNSVAGNGMIEAQTENIAVGSTVPGLVVQVFAKEGDPVHTGDPLFRLDDRELKAQLKVREADVVAAKAQLQQLDNEPRPEEVPVNEAMVTEAEADLTQQRDNLRRIQELSTRRVATEQELTQAQQNCNMAQARLTHAKAQLNLLKAGAWQYQKDVAKAAIEQAQSQVEMTKTQLDRLVIRALVDGEILQVNVRPGEYVGAPHNDTLMLLGNTIDLHVRVDIDEHDIPRFNLNAPARAIIKGHPEISFPLTFVRVDPYVVPKKSLTGMNTERVDTRVLQVIYSFEPGKLPVFVGQQVEVFLEAANPSSAAAAQAAPASTS
jgi:HlyD family secretion protein